MTVTSLVIVNLEAHHWMRSLLFLNMILCCCSPPLSMETSFIFLSDCESSINELVCCDHVAADTSVSPITIHAGCTNTATGLRK